MCEKSTVSMIAVFLLSLSTGQARGQQTLDQQASVQQIGMLHQQWVAAVKSKDIGTIVGLYAVDGVIMPPNAESAQGREAIRRSWEQLLQLPDVSFVFEPSTIRATEAGDMAYEIGTYALSFESTQGRAEDIGKYVVVWTKEDGVWKAAVDVYNSNLPVPR
jgi:uncharacterized protein (TIGR02246 family)